MKKFLRKTLYMSANLPAYNTDREIGFDIFGKQPLTQQLSRGEICVENFIPPCEWYKSRYLFSQKLTE